MKQENDKKKIVIIGAGFGGLSAARKLAKSQFDITIIDKANYHLFQPLLYQVATAALSPGDIAKPIRSLVSSFNNTKVLLGEVKSVDKLNKTLRVNDETHVFDYLIVATGVRHSYFGNDVWEKYAPAMKTLGDALKIREKILLSMEEAEAEDNELEKQKYLNYVIIGGGPTGVELAGAISEIVNKNIIPDFKNITASMTKVFLVEALPRILSTYPESLSRKALKDLQALEVEVLLGKKVTSVSDEGVEIGEKFIPTKNVIWAAGNESSPLIKTLEIETDNIGRAIVEEDLSIPESPNIFVIGDAAAVDDGKGQYLPGIAPVAIQQGQYVANIIMNPNSRRKKFKYRDRGMMATIGKAKAVGVVKGINVSGLIAWLGWSLVHILYLISFRNKLKVLAEWMLYYLTNRPGIRLIVNGNKYN